MNRTRLVRGDELAALAREARAWEACRTASPRPQLLQRPELFTRWTDGDPQAVVVEDPDGTPTALALLSRSDRRRAWSVRLRSSRPTLRTFTLDTLELVGEDFAGPGDPATTRALFDGVLAAGADADVIAFRNVPAGSALASITAHHLLGSGRWLCVDDRYPDFRHRADLAADLDTYLGRHLGSGSRRYLQRDVRRLQRHPDGSTVRCFTEAAEMAELLDAVAVVEADSWHLAHRSRRLGGVAATRRRLEDWAGLGLVRAYVLAIGGKPVAFVLGYASDGCLWVAKMGFAEAWARRSPGKVLLWHVLDDLHRIGGFTAIDLGPGTWPFKHQFAPDGYHVRDVTLVRTRPRALVAVVPSLLWGRARAEVSRVLQERSGAGARAQAWVRRNLAR